MAWRKKTSGGENPEDSIEFHKSLGENMEILNRELANCPDIIRRNLLTDAGLSVCILFITEFADKNLVQRDIISELMKIGSGDMQDLKEGKRIPISSFKVINKLEEVIDEVLKGNTVVLMDKADFAISYEARKFEQRAIKEPDVEKIIKGSHEGFIENLDVNLSMLRRRVKSSRLKFKILQVGKRSNSNVTIAYIEDIANPELICEMENRIKTIEYDALSGAGYIEQITADSPISPLPQYQMTERPDKVAANLMEGRIAVLLDGTPVALLMPVNFFQFFQSVDDYTTSWAFGTFVRLLRFVAILIAVFLPALYIAILTYHYQAIPLGLLIPLAESRSRVPFPPIIEALLMEVTFELLREASVRLPSNLGPTIGIVGGLVIGQTAIEAGIVSNIMVIVVAITGIATFVVPTYDMGLLLRLLRFGAMILAAVFGIAGLALFTIWIFAHAVTLESLGQPYMQPLAPLKPDELGDTLIRLPFRFMKKRSGVAKPQDRTRGRAKSGNK